MLLEKHRLGELEAYIATGGNVDLIKWWAKYCESIGDHAAARLYYARAADHLSLVSADSPFKCRVPVCIAACNISSIKEG